MIATIAQSSTFPYLSYIGTLSAMKWNGSSSFTWCLVPFWLQKHTKLDHFVSFLRQYQVRCMSALRASPETDPWSMKPTSFLESTCPFFPSPWPVGCVSVEQCWMNYPLLWKTVSWPHYCGVAWCERTHQMHLWLHLSIWIMSEAFHLFVPDRTSMIPFSCFQPSETVAVCKAALASVQEMWSRDSTHPSLQTIQWQPLEEVLQQWVDCTDTPEHVS